MDNKAISRNTCSVCQKTFVFDFDPAPLPASGAAMIPNPIFVSHCAEGSKVAVIGRLKTFWEVDGDRLIEVQPFISDIQ
jgi:hypothetical protein